MGLGYIHEFHVCGISDSSGSCIHNNGCLWQCSHFSKRVDSGYFDLLGFRNCDFCICGIGITQVQLSQIPLLGSFYGAILQTISKNSNIQKLHSSG